MPDDLTIDVGVLMAASSLGDAVHQAPSLALAKHVEATAGWGIALDNKGLIRHQYTEKLRYGTFAHHWLIRLSSLNKIVFVKSHIGKATRVKLDELHFDTEDRKYVATAAQTGSGIIVTHDRDYSPPVRAALKKIDVTPLSAGQAIAL